MLAAALCLVGLAACQTVFSPEDPRYCTPDNGFRLGRIAARYDGVCAGPGEADFLYARDLGLAVYNTSIAAADARRDAGTDSADDFWHERWLWRMRIVHPEAMRAAWTADETRRWAEAAFLARFGRPVY